MRCELSLARMQKGNDGSGSIAASQYAYSLFHHTTIPNRILCPYLQLHQIQRTSELAYMIGPNLGWHASFRYEGKPLPKAQQSGTGSGALGFACQGEEFDLVLTS